MWAFATVAQQGRVPTCVTCRYSSESEPLSPTAQISITCVVLKVSRCSRVFYLPLRRSHILTNVSLLSHTSVDLKGLSKLRLHTHIIDRKVYVQTGFQ